MGPAIKDETLRKESSGRNTFLEVSLMVRNVIAASILPENLKIRAAQNYIYVLFCFWNSKTI